MKFIHVVAHDNICFSILLHHIPFNEYRVIHQLIHSTVDSYLTCFRFGSLNKAVMDIPFFFLLFLNLVLCFCLLLLFFFYSFFMFIFVVVMDILMCIF